jgi:hypothetical protein
LVALAELLLWLSNLSLFISCNTYRAFLPFPQQALTAAAAVVVVALLLAPQVDQ